MISEALRLLRRYTNESNILYIPWWGFDCPTCTLQVVQDNALLTKPEKDDIRFVEWADTREVEPVWLSPALREAVGKLVDVPWYGSTVRGTIFLKFITNASANPQ